MKKQLLAILCLTLSLSAEPPTEYETLTLTTGKKYEGVTISKIEKGGIRIIHNGGARTIPIEDLPEGIRIELGMSMEGVKAHRENQAKARKENVQRARIIEANKKLLKESHLYISSAKAFQIVDGGVLARVSRTWDGKYREIQQYKKVRTGNALRGYKTVRVKNGSKKVKAITYHDDWLIYVSCDSSKWVDGTNFSGDVWAAGRYSYTTAIGGGKTIPRYTTNPKEITKR